MSTDSPPRTPTWPPEQARRLDSLCDRFEASWQQVGPGLAPPRIEDVLHEAADEDRPALLRELIGLEVYYRRQRGEDPGPEEYRQRFPELDSRWLVRTLAGRPDPEATRTVPAAPDPGGPAPAVLDRFELLEEVGFGGFGTVWRARDTRLGRTVALKITNSTLRGSHDQLKRCQREARAAAQLRHPGIVTVHEVADLDGLPVLVCDFVAGGSLRDLARDRRLTAREAAALVAEVAEAVDYAHGMGLVHRDLKPGNILLESADERQRRPAAGHRLRPRPPRGRGGHPHPGGRDPRDARRT